MKNRTAGLFFLLVCVVLATLLLAKVIKIFLSGIAFAIALVAIGLLSRGSGKQRDLHNSSK
jgi:galactitol-specific phosphotransferase system IIC component